jgi:hypothetical protein
VFRFNKCLARFDSSFRFCSVPDPTRAGPSSRDEALPLSRPANHSPPASPRFSAGGDYDRRSITETNT